MNHTLDHINKTSNWLSTSQEKKEAPSISSDIRAYIFNLINRGDFVEIPVWKAIKVNYNEGKPIHIRFWWNNQNSTELVLMSQRDFEKVYPMRLNVPFILIDKSLISSASEKIWFKWVREGEVIRVGRSDHCTKKRFTLDRDTKISRSHAEIILSSLNGIIIRDLYSTNGTFVRTSSNVTPYLEWIDERGKKICVQNQALINTDPFLKKLWPNIHQWMKQWKVGNCYFVAALHAIKEHPEWYKLLKEIIQPDPSGKYRVILHGRSCHTLISKRDLAEMEEHKIEGCLGDNILERAYWRLRRKEQDMWYNDEWVIVTDDPYFELTRDGHTAFATDWRGRKSHEGWTLYEVLDAFFGDLVQTKNINLLVSDGINNHILKVFSEIRWDELLIASTPSIRQLNISEMNTFFPKNCSLYEKVALHLRRELWRYPSQNEVYKKIQSDHDFGDRAKFVIRDIYNEQKTFHFQHAYTIGEFDFHAWYIEIINPHNTVTQRSKIKIIDFIKYFDDLSITKIEPHFIQEH
jgi:hypothetical protein